MKTIHKLSFTLIILVLTACSTIDITSEPKKVASVAFLEGPAWHPDGTVFFSDIPNNRIMRWSGKGPATIHRTPSSHANGLIVDQQGRLVIAETDGRLVREKTDGSVEVLADSFNNKPFNSLNDLAIDSKGRIYFTDPAYRNRAKATQRNKQGDIVDGVYRYDSSGTVTRLQADSIEMPNGIVVSPNDQYLYIANNSNLSGGARQLVRYDLDGSGNLVPESSKVLFDWGTERGPDGMTIDSLGNIYVAAGLNRPMPNRTAKKFKAGIYVISPEGQLLEFIPIHTGQVSNVTFGGPDLKTLYITGGHDLFSHEIDTPGFRP